MPITALARTGLVNEHEIFEGIYEQSSSKPETTELQVGLFTSESYQYYQIRKIWSAKEIF